MKKALYILPILLVVLSSCQEVIDVDLVEGKKRIIINGRITDSLPVIVNIYNTADYLSNVPNPAINDAIVDLFEDGIKVASLTASDTADGQYESSFTGVIGKEYHIEVQIPEGHPYFPNTTWISRPELMKRMPVVDSTYSKFFPREPFVEEGYYAFIMFTDPAGKGDNYRFRLWKNDSLYATQFDLTVFRDDFFDGLSFNDDQLPALQISGASDTGDVYKLEMSSLTLEGIKFLELLSEQTTQVGSTFDPPPAPIFGNIVNANDPNDLGLGYFFASSLSYGVVEIKE